MGHDKLRKFAENETFSCLIQPSSRELLEEGFFNLKDHPIKGCWREKMFPSGAADAPLVLELGCGKGEYTIDLALRNPGSDYVGVDIKGARLWKGAGYATREGLKNVAFLRTRVEFITAFFAPGEVSGIWLTFSDPQMRSENSRLSSPLFLERYRSILRPGGVVHLKTDSMFLHRYTRAVCEVNRLKIISCTEDLYGTDDPSIPEEVRGTQTFYEKMFREQGYNITYLAFAIDHDGPFVSPRDPEDFDSARWRSAEGPRLLFGHDSAETRRQKLNKNSSYLAKTKVL